MAVLIHRHYEFLLADPTSNREYTEGNISGGYVVYGTAEQMKSRFQDVFKGMQIPYATSLAPFVTAWHVQDCTLLYHSKADRQVSGKPNCFGHLMVTGSEPNVEKVSTLLADSFPRIDDLVRDTKREF